MAESAIVSFMGYTGDRVLVTLARASLAGDNAADPDVVVV